MHVDALHSHDSECIYAHFHSHSCDTDCTHCMHNQFFCFFSTESHLITSYTLTLFTNESACTSHASEIERYRGISGDASYFVVKALAPERAPRIKCLYQYTVSSKHYVILICLQLYQIFKGLMNYQILSWLVGPLLLCYFNHEIHENISFYSYMVPSSSFLPSSPCSPSFALISFSLPSIASSLPEQHSKLHVWCH